jgi:periplasmic protein TonB
MLPIASPSRGAVSPGVLRVMLIGVAALLFVAALIAVARSLSRDTPHTTRQVSRIAVLPDTPPPPPPPQKPQETQREQRATPQPLRNAPPTPKADAPIKMEGAAGDGPSAFAAGEVTNEYSGGAPVVGGGASAPGIADRAQERLYANSVRQLLRDEIERQLRAEAGELTSSFAIWISADGRIDRFDLDPGATSEKDNAMRDALEASSRSLRLPPPPSDAPLRFRLTVRASG